MGRARIKTDESDRSGLPVTFRPGPDLDQLARPFVERHELAPAAAFKCLAALALIGLDQRHYSLVVQLAKAFVGDNPFPRACVYIQAAFAGVAAVRNGLVVVEEPHRSQLVFDVVERYLRDRDIKVDVTGLWFTPTGAEPAGLRATPTVGFTNTAPAPEPESGDSGSAEKSAGRAASEAKSNSSFDRVRRPRIKSKAEYEREEREDADGGEGTAS